MLADGGHEEEDDIYDDTPPTLELSDTEKARLYDEMVAAQASTPPNQPLYRAP